MSEYWISTVILLLVNLLAGLSTFLLSDTMRNELSCTIEDVQCIPCCEELKGVKEGEKRGYKYFNILKKLSLTIHLR